LVQHYTHDVDRNTVFCKRIWISNYTWKCLKGGTVHVN